MKTGFFLLNMRIKGIKNIQKEVQIDFYGKNVDKRFDPEKYRIKGIYGENGSGKTAIITAVDVVRNYVINENYFREAQNQQLLKELINKETQQFEFCCEFLVKGWRAQTLCIYEYEVRFDFDEIGEIYTSYESLKYKKNSSRGNSVDLFICENGKFSALNLDDDKKHIIIEKTKNLLIKQSALLLIIKSCMDEETLAELLVRVVPAFLFFCMIVVHFDKEDKHIHYYQNALLKNIEDKGIPDEQMIEEIRSCIPTNTRRIPVNQFGNYEKKVKQLEAFIRVFKPDLERIDIEKKDNRDYYECELNLVYGKYSVNREFESTGIKKVIELYDALRAASTGFIAFIDELDSNINDIYLCKIIEYFRDYGEGQLCFTSHNLDPMSILKKNNKSIDFLTGDNRIVPWVKNGNYTPDNSYRNGMIEGMPFNIDSSDFIRIFEGGE